MGQGVTKLRRGKLRTKSDREVASVFAEACGANEAGDAGSNVTSVELSKALTELFSVFVSTGQCDALLASARKKSPAKDETLRRADFFRLAAAFERSLPEHVNFSDPDLRFVSIGQADRIGIGLSQVDDFHAPVVDKITGGVAQEANIPLGATLKFVQGEEVEPGLGVESVAKKVRDLKASRSAFTLGFVLTELLPRGDDLITNPVLAEEVPSADCVPLRRFPPAKPPSVQNSYLQSLLGITCGVTVVCFMDDDEEDLCGELEDESDDLPETFMQSKEMEWS